MNGSFIGKSWVTVNGFPSSLCEENVEENRLREDELEWSESPHGFSAYVKMESLLVEWTCGQGLTVLPPTTSQ